MARNLKSPNASLLHKEVYYYKFMKLGITEVYAVYFQVEETSFRCANEWHILLKVDEM